MTDLVYKKVNLLTLLIPSGEEWKKVMKIGFLAQFLLGYPLQGAETAVYEDLETIRSTAEKFALDQLHDQKYKDISSVANSLDARLQLHKCDIPLQAFSTSTAANTIRITVGIRCTGNKPWTLYVPVTIDGSIEVVRTTRQFSRGELLQQAGIEKISLPLSQLPPNYINDLSNISYMEFTRNVKPGTILTLNSMKIRQIIQRGQEVVIEAKGSGVLVRMNGEALANGSIGDLIPVRNQNSGREIQAMILNGHTVSVKM